MFEELYFETIAEQARADVPLLHRGAVKHQDRDEDAEVAEQFLRRAA